MNIEALVREEGSSRSPNRNVYRLGVLEGREVRVRRVCLGATLTALCFSSSVFLAVLSEGCSRGEERFHLSCTHTVTGGSSSAKENGSIYAVSSAVFFVLSVLFGVITKSVVNTIE